MRPIDFGMTLEEACEAVSAFAACLPPISADDINLVRLNPSLSKLDKFFIIRKMKKQMNYDKAKKEWKTLESFKNDSHLQKGGYAK